MNQNMFCSEVELSSFLGTSHIIQNAYDANFAISNTDLDPYKLYTNFSGYKVLVFGFSVDDTAKFLDGEAHDLVSSEDHTVVNFIATKVNQSFFINRFAVSLFDSLFGKISEPEDKLVSETLVITGQALGGYVATLFALWLQSVVDKKESNGTKKTKRPICITFGSPLIGDEAFQRAILERPLWKSCFLNVVSNMDPIPRLLLSSNHGYKAFGTYLFFSESGGYSCFEDHDSILGVLEAVEATASSNMQMNDYGKVLHALKKKALYRGVSELGEFDFNPLRAGITLQLIEVGVLNPDVDNSMNDLVGEMEKKQAKLIKRKRNVYEPSKKLNDMKISLTYMEWYMKLGRPKGGYYKAYKKPTNKDQVSHQEIIKHKRMLNQYWNTFVMEKDRMPQIEGGKLRTRWLLGGNNYRRIVEPLDIAEHYKVEGNRDYLAQRPEHYVLLEKWLDEDKKGKDQDERRNKAASLTEDSCFWARVEEAFNLLRELKRGDIDVSGHAEELVEFENYVIGSISEYAVSSEIFLEGSIFMEWWGEYKAYKGKGHKSSLAQYMNNESYTSYS